MFERIKELCRKRGISVNDLESSLGYSKNTLYRLKTQNPGADKLEAIADYFDVSTDYLLGRTEIDWSKYDNMLTPEHLEAIARVEKESEIKNLIHIPIDDEINKEQIKEALEDKTFVMMQRNAIKMTPEQRRKSLKILEAAFDDDDLWDN